MLDILMEDADIALAIWVHDPLLFWSSDIRMSLPTVWKINKEEAEMVKHSG
jgi:hypothetical protein